MAYEIQPQPRVIKYLKKIKDRHLKELFIDKIYTDIAVNPTIGEATSGDLAGFRSLGFKYARTAYRIAYIIDDATIVIIILVGAHENFYQELKKIAHMKNND
ncbi:type II toxin-antitoxin system RelE/ParE family toxin [Loigolactobacillus zhaoyuanensis]|uniref:Type II toxin-antitoxin system RelE/ParE family toxin n=1 Tax=Loigolactobacillus zhaoyuanensis TaxID=2486017 RepID=A0ABW8UD71_9LACO|nr:type II toxin-antitoxin system RelE/ParE family toxin [Loigolactobacillus zhaoyuanensis]